MLEGQQDMEVKSMVFGTKLLGSNLSVIPKQTDKVTSTPCCISTSIKWGYINAYSSKECLRIICEVPKMMPELYMSLHVRTRTHTHIFDNHMNVDKALNLDILYMEATYFLVNYYYLL